MVSHYFKGHMNLKICTAPEILSNEQGLSLKSESGMATLLQSMQCDNDFMKCFLKNEELPKANKKSKETFKSKPYQTLPKIMSNKKKPYLIHFERKLSQLQASENERDVHN